MNIILHYRNKPYSDKKSTFEETFEKYRKELQLKYMPYNMTYYFK